MQREPQERSLNELIEIAKRAQSILGHLDLEAIASHDPDAVAKLASVANAIQALDEGEDVGFIPASTKTSKGRRCSIRARCAARN